jgi:hypothetical protein
MSTEHDYTKPSIASLEARLGMNTKEACDRESRIANCEMEPSDGALSMWANSSMNGLYRTQLELARNGWMHDFHVLYRHGVRVTGKEMLVKFGYKSSYRWCINGEWFPSYYVGDTGRKLKNFQKHGFSWVVEKIPAHAAQHFGNYIGAPVHTSVKPDERDIITRIPCD